MTSLPGPRLTYGLIVAACIFALAFAYYLDGVLGLEPCPLCMTQRVIVGACGLIALIAAVHGSQGIMHRVYAVLAMLIADAGIAVAGRHVWLQHLPEDQVPACGPGLAYMLENFPFTETLQLILMGDGNCADVVWTLAGLSIPEQTLILFIVLGGACVWQLIRRLPTAETLHGI